MLSASDALTLTDTTLLLVCVGTTCVRHLVTIGGVMSGRDGYDCCCTRYRVEGSSVANQNHINHFERRLVTNGPHTIRATRIETLGWTTIDAIKDNHQVPMKLQSA